MFSHNSNSYDDTENEGLLFSLVLSVANVFSCCTKSQKRDQATYVDVKPSQAIVAQEKKGMFATSFDQIPADGPIYDYQYRTGRRYVTGDNFPRANDLDIYLARHKSLCSIDSTNSLDLATEANLDFHILADQFVDLFAEVSEAEVEQLRSQFPNEVAYFLEHGERLTTLVVKQEFTRQNGSENLEALQEIVEILRGMNLGKFFSVLSQTSGSKCSSVSTFGDLPLSPLPIEKMLPKAFSPTDPAQLKSKQWFTDRSEGSDSGESLENPMLTEDLILNAEDLTLEINSSLKGFTPISETNVEFKHRSAVEVFEEWAAIQSPCVSPW